MNAPGFFTALAPHRLPHPAIPLRIILTTHAALVKAFELFRVASAGDFQMATAKEDAITRQLHAILEDRFLTTKEVPGFDRRRIRNVVRAPEITNYDGTHPAKKPDLVLFLLKREHISTRSSQDGVFAECKPVDGDHAIGTHYCDRGISRFINGDYAWAMQEGMMIAYVRGERTIEKDLAPVLAGKGRHIILGSPEPPCTIEDATAQATGERLHSTTHRRSFAWPGGQGACEIRLFHSWHACV